jgi:hypothetical protein
VTSVVVRISFIFNGRTGFAFYLELFPDLGFFLMSVLGLGLCPVWF